MIVAALIAIQTAPPPEWLRGAWTEVHRQGGVIISIDESATRRDGDLVRIRISGGRGEESEARLPPGEEGEE